MFLITYPSPLLSAAASQLLTNLVAYYKLGEASGTRSDSVGTSHLTSNNGVGQIAGKQGNAASFVRANSTYLSVADSATLSMNGTDFTVACWVRLTSKPSGAADMNAVSKWDYGSTQREFQIGYNGAQDRFNFSVSSNGTTQTHLFATSLGSPALDTWYLVVGWYDSVRGTLNIQVNNGPVNSVAYTAGVFNSTAPFVIGAMNSVSALDNVWDGGVDEVGLWRRVLTANERGALYNAGAGTTHPFSVVSAFVPGDLYGLYAWWKADAITGKAAGDTVSSWTDSNSGLVLSQGSTAASPLYRTGGPGGQPYLDLSDGARWMSNTSVAITSGFTMFLVFAGTSALVSGARILEFNNATAANQGRVRFSAGGWGMYSGSNAAATSGPQSANASYVQGGWIVAAMRWQNAANANLIHNGTVRTNTGDMSPVTPTGLFLGSSITGSNRSNIYVAEMLVYNAAISTTDEFTVLAYLNSKYGGIY